jgi:endonuclease III
MGNLTLELMHRTVSPRKATFWRRRFGVIADLLRGAYGVPSLGNFRNPVKEVFYIVLSARTGERQYRRIHRRLFGMYATLGELATAPVRGIRACIRDGGLANKRARQVRDLAMKLLSDFGQHPEVALRMMTPSEAFGYLAGLPGVGPKSALCVLMYSLDLDVFPVDVHINRVAARIGVIPKELKHYQAQVLLPGLVPEGRSKDLHIGLILHGRRVCVPRVPRCCTCILRPLCRTGKAKGVA